jgi:pentapeptide MXKDX repeat protein
MKRALFLATVCLLAIMVFAPAALAQDTTMMEDTMMQGGDTMMEDTMMQGGDTMMEDTMMEDTMMEDDDLPESGGPAILLPAAALLLGSGILTYAVLRRR